MITIKEMLPDSVPLDAIALAQMSDAVWDLGSLSDIREQVSPELFCLQIGINMIGNWQGDGWWGIISNEPELVPFIPSTLEKLGLHELRAAFDKVIGHFPEFTVFSDEDDAYCDVINFLTNQRFKVDDKRLQLIDPEKRSTMIAGVRRSLNELEELTGPLWGYDADHDGWKVILDFIAAHS